MLQHNHFGGPRAPPSHWGPQSHVVVRAKKADGLFEQAFSNNSGFDNADFHSMNVPHSSAWSFEEYEEEEEEESGKRLEGALVEAFELGLNHDTIARQVDSTDRVGPSSCGVRASPPRRAIPRRRLYLLMYP